MDRGLNAGRLWPDPSIGLNPTFASGGRIDDLVGEGLLHSACRDIFRVNKVPDSPLGQQLRLHRHQEDAIRRARAGRSFVMTTGTGSGKSLGYIVPAVDHMLRAGSGQGIKALIVYPMNALANSQIEELDKFLAPLGDATKPTPQRRSAGGAAGFSLIAGPVPPGRPRATNS
ncbi:MAG: DEAD/DEAH box helicase [bacterium]|nr:DEAD/DEAH box helicase [bacterium]